MQRHLERTLIEGLAGLVAAGDEGVTLEEDGEGEGKWMIFTQDEPSAA